MKPNWKTLFLLTTCCTLGLMTTARAQVSSDGTLSTTVTSPNNLNFTINNGNRVGGNLFHSFREFSVPNGGSAVFQNALDVQNIISRVTGGSLSQINGLIQAQGSANLFLLNPAGISFGQNARLNIGGSFFATTADSLLFGDGIEFSATNAIAPLLTVNIPVGLRFRDNPGNITNQSVVQDNIGSTVGLQVNPGNSLALVGGNVNLEQGGRLTAAGGRIELGGLAGAGTVGLQTTGNTFRLNFPINGLSNVSLLDEAQATVRSNGAGDIAVNANIFTGRNGGQLVAGVEGIATRNGGDITVNSNDISFDGVSRNEFISGIFNQVQGNAVGNAGGIDITTKNLSFTNGSVINSSISGRGNAGNVILRAENGDISLAGRSLILNTVGSGGMGNAGKIDIITRNFSLTDGAQLQTLVSGGEQQSNAGNITVQASGTVRIAGRNSNGQTTAILSNVLSGANGNAGNIIINAGSIFTDDALLIARNDGNGLAGDVRFVVGDAIALTNGSQINSSISGRGNAGNVTLRAENGDISIAGRSLILNGVESGGMGNAGKIDIITRNLSLTDGAQLQTLVSGGEQQSNAGNITVQASGTVRIAGGNSNGNPTGILSNVLSGASGNAGNIIINAGSIFTDNALLTARNQGNGSAGNISLQVGDAITLTNNSQINSSISGRGNAGNVTLRAENGDISLAGRSLILNRVEFGGMGNAGKIDIITRNLSLTDGAQLQTLVSGGEQQSNAGNITVQASGTVRIAGGNSNGNPTGILSNVLSGASGNAGNIIINAGSIFTDNALLTARNQGNGSAGNISLQVGDAITLTNNSQINSSTFGTGNASNVTLRAENGDISLADGSLILNRVESGGIGNAGKIDIITRNFSLTDGAQLQTLVSAGEQSNAGNITVQASGTVRIAGRNSNGQTSSILSNVLSGASGNGGNIIINAGSIFTDDALLIARNQGNGSAGNISLQVGDAIALTNGSSINSSISGRGNAGNVTLRAENGDISLAGVSNIFSTVGSGGMGNAGKIDIITRNLSLTDGAQLQTLVSGGEQSNAGNITVQASGTVRIAGRNSNGQTSSILSNVLSGASGNAGNIIINAGSIFTDDALLIARNQGNGLAGDITLNARDQVSLNQSRIESDGNSGNGGDITLNIGNFLRLQNESLISANARGQQGGNGGNITINTPFIVAFPRNNDITANAGNGSGGQVIINATLFGIAPLSAADLRRLRPNDLDPRQLPTSDITAISRDNPSLSGNVQVTSPDVDPSRGLVELPETVSDRTQQIAQSPCKQGFGNEFVITGRGGLPTTPNETLSSNNVRVDLLQPVASSGNSPSATIKPATNPTATRVPAQGWIFNDKGQVVLTAYDPTNTGSQRSWRTAAACPAR